MALKVDAKAIVAADACLADDVTIGAFAVVGAGSTLGRGSKLMPHAVVGENVKAGAGNIFHPFACVGGRSQDLKYAGEPTYLEIGDANEFREFVTINRATAKRCATKIGNDCLFLAYSHVAHDCVVGDKVIFSNNGTLAGHIEVGDYAIMGGLSAAHQFCRIGKHAIVGGCSKIVRDIPPFCIADGNPAVLRGLNLTGLKRREFSHESISALKLAYRMLFRQGLSPKKQAQLILSEVPKDKKAEKSSALSKKIISAEISTNSAQSSKLEKLPLTPEVVDMAKFVAESKRGICAVNTKK